MEVQAETLYEAAALAVVVFREHDCLPGVAANLEVEIRSSVVHALSIQKVQRWLEAAAKSPKEAMLKKKLRESIA